MSSFGDVKCCLWCVLYVIYGAYWLLSIGGVVFVVFWWCKVLSMVCNICYLCGVIYLLRMGLYCFPSFGGVKCCLWCVLYVVYLWCSVCRLLAV